MIVLFWSLPVSVAGEEPVSLSTSMPEERLMLKSEPVLMVSIPVPPTRLSLALGFRKTTPRVVKPEASKVSLPVPPMRVVMPAVWALAPRRIRLLPFAVMRASTLVTPVLCVRLKSSSVTERASITKERVSLPLPPTTLLWRRWSPVETTRLSSPAPPLSVMPEVKSEASRVSLSLPPMNVRMPATSCAVAPRTNFLAPVVAARRISTPERPPSWVSARVVAEEKERVSVPAAPSTVLRPTAAASLRVMLSSPAPESMERELERGLS